MDTKQLQNISKKIAKQFNLSLVVLFGSQINGTQRKDSDYDIGVISKQKVETEEFFELIHQFTEELKCDADIVVLNQVEDPLLLNNVAKQSKILFEEQEGLYDEFVVNSIFNYIDYAPLYVIEEEIVNKKLEML